MPSNTFSTITETAVKVFTFSSYSGVDTHQDAEYNMFWTLALGRQEC